MWATVGHSQNELHGVHRCESCQKYFWREKKVIQNAAVDVMKPMISKVHIHASH